MGSPPPDTQSDLRPSQQPERQIVLGRNLSNTDRSLLQDQSRPFGWNFAPFVSLRSHRKMVRPIVQGPAIIELPAGPEGSVIAG
tara:strand:- start:14544 stop:14795 length:252 start_codon:yes stop_codon:yes gene_type:complete